MSIIDFHVHAGKFHLLRDDIQALLKRKLHAPSEEVSALFSNPARLEAHLRSLGVDRAIVLAECGPGTNFSIDSAMIAEFCAGSSLLIPFGNINPCHHDVRTEFDKSLTLGIRGFKFYPADHGYDPFSTEMKLVYCECAERGLPVMFHTGLSAQRDASQRYIRPRDFEPLCRDLPGLIVILAHAGRPNWFEDACQMALEYPNLYLDTGLLRAEEIERCLSFAPSVRHKLLFGSDWPICGSYSTHIAELSGGGISPDSEPELFFSNGRALLDRMRIA